MSIVFLYRQFLANTNRLKCKMNAIYAIPRNHQDWRFQYASVALLSELWQVWCRFCCQLMVSICMGTQLRDGTIVSGRPGNNNRNRVAYEVLTLSRGGTPASTKVCSYIYQEPTWGDVNMLLRALPLMNISHSSHFITAFGISVQSPSHLQIVRNACNHLDNENMKKVRAIQPYYIGSANKHPYELMWCIESSSQSEAIYFWLDELLTIADLATYKNCVSGSKALNL
jgi:hypothetical protein